MASESRHGYGSTPEVALEAGGLCGHLSSGNSTWLTAGLIVADVVGAGVLGLSVAVAKVGWLPGVMLTFFLLAMNVHIAMLMWRVRMHFDNIRSYREMVDAAFSRAPEGERYAISMIAGMGQYFFIFTMLGLYMLTAGRALGNLFYSFYICLPTWMLLTCALVLPFHATARRLGTWQSLVWFNAATILGTCLIPLVYMTHYGTSEMRPPGSEFVSVAPFSLSNALGATSTFCFAYTSQFMAVEIMSEMKNPEHFPKAYVGMAAPFQGAAYLVVGLGGYFFVGDKVTGMIGDNIPFGPVFQAAAFCLLAHMAVAYVIKGIVLCRAMHFATDKDADENDSRSAWMTWGIICVCTAVLAWLTASIIPFFNEFVNLVGSSMTPICAYIIPIAAYLRWVKDFGSKENTISKFENAVILGELALAVTLLVFGTGYAIAEIMEKWHTFGPPFSCHCQHMWNTCECSGTHAGMLDQCLGVAKEIAMQVNEMVDLNFAWMMRPPLELVSAATI